MAYTSINFKTKKQLKEAVAAGQQVRVFQPGGLFPLRPGADGKVYLEGPHYPAPHSWYASARVDQNCCIIPGTVR